MFANVNGIHVIELIKKLPTNGCRHGEFYDPMDVFDLFDSIEYRFYLIKLFNYGVVTDQIFAETITY